VSRKTAVSTSSLASLLRAALLCFRTTALSTSGFSSASQSSTALSHGQQLFPLAVLAALLFVMTTVVFTIQTFLPKRYSAVVSDDDIDQINIHKVSLNIIYKRICVKSKSYLLAIEK